MTKEELILKIERISSELDQQANDTEGVWHMWGSVAWRQIITELVSQGKLCNLVSIEDAVKRETCEDTPEIEVWEIGGQQFDVRTWQVWHGGPNSGSWQPFWEWSGETAEFRKQMHEVTGLFRDLRKAANNMLTELIND